MNIYGCIQSPFLSSHPTLTYWAQAASLAGITSPDPNLIASNSLSLGLKKSHLPLNLCDVIRKSTSDSAHRAISRASGDLPSSFRVTTSRVGSASSPAGHREAFISLEDQERLHQQLQLQMQQLQCHRYLHHQQHIQQQPQQEKCRQGKHHQPFSASSPPPVGNGIAPLQALCESDVSAFRSKSSHDPGNSDAHKASMRDDSPARRAGEGSAIKFSINRILSDDFGKTKNEKENSFQLSSVPEEYRSLPLCPCSSAQCTAYATRQLSPLPYPRAPLPSLSAVHALQPPCYPLSSSVDALPGPYSILSSDPGSSSNQPKRKRSWSRAVFSNLQRKGLEKRFEVQKYVTKPDRRQLAAMLGLTDAQVKVWFQNRRMKWRHAQQQQEDKDKEDMGSPPGTGDHNEMRTHHVQGDHPADKGLDLRSVCTKEESSIVDIETSSGEAETSRCSTDDEQILQEAGLGQNVNLHKTPTTSFVSPAAHHCGLGISKESTNGSLFSLTAFMSTPKSNNKVATNFHSTYTESKKFFSRETKGSVPTGGDDVFMAVQQQRPPHSPAAQSTLGIRAEPDSSVTSDTSAVFTVQDKNNCSTQTNNLPIDSNSFNEGFNISSMRIKEVHGLQKDSTDAVTVDHIDVDI